MDPVWDRRLTYVILTLVVQEQAEPFPPHPATPVPLTEEMFHEYMAL